MNGTRLLQIIATVSALVAVALGLGTYTHVDFTSMEALLAGKAVTLTAQEFKLLKFFAGSPGRVLTRDELLNEVWGYNCYPSTRTVDNHLVNLRQKLEKDPLQPNHFKTVHGVGYKFVS